MNNVVTLFAALLVCVGTASAQLTEKCPKGERLVLDKEYRESEFFCQACDSTTTTDYSVPAPPTNPSFGSNITMNIPVYYHTYTGNTVDLGEVQLYEGSHEGNPLDYTITSSNESVAKFSTTSPTLLQVVGVGEALIHVSAEEDDEYYADWNHFLIRVTEPAPTPCIITSGTCGDNLTWELSCDDVLTISGTGEMTIGSPWSTDREYITSVIINNGVTSICDNAFERCTGLTSVTIPNSVTSIGESAFRGCTGLTSVTIPNSVTSIGHMAFQGCTGLTSVEVPNSVTSIGGFVFNGCRSLTSPVYNAHIFAYMPTSYSGAYAIQNGIQTIAYGAFYNCTGLTSVTIPESVTSIGEEAFWDCTGLTSIEIPNSVTSIGDGAFNNVRNIVYSGSATGAPWGAKYMNCFVEGWFVYSDETKTQLLSCATSAEGEIEIPNSVTSIGGGAFQNCSYLTSVTIPESVTSIGMWAFSGCSGLTSVIIPNSVKNIDSYAFRDCTGLTSVIIGDSVNSIGAGAFENCTGLTSIDIPNSVTSIGSYAFWDCSGLTSVTIGNSVTSIGIYAFEDCTSLTSVHISDIAAWCNIVFETNTAHPLAYAHNLYLNENLVTNLIIPESVTSIGDWAFYGCSCLTSVTIPESVTSIGDFAFYGCTGLTSPVYTAHVFAFMPTSYSGGYAIPEGIESITGGAFYGCKSMTDIEIPNSVTSIGGAAFQNCSSLTSVTIPESVTSIKDQVFCNCTGLTSIIIPNNVTSIGGYAFYGCSGLTSVTIGNSVTSIGDWAFRDCTGLTCVTCLAPTPPNSNGSVLYNVDCSQIPLYVPAGSEDLYRGAPGWGNFTNIYPIPAAEPTTDAQVVVVSTSSNSVTLEWPNIEGASTYIVTIVNVAGDTICTLVFDANGYLQNADYAAMPAKDGASHTKTMATQVETGWQYVVSGLTPNTEYTYSIVAKNEDEAEIYSEATAFTTAIATSIEEVSSSLQGRDRGRLILHDGQIYILCGEKVYTLQGQEVK